MNTGAAIGKWAYWIMAYNILLAIAIGFVAGYVARRLLKFAEQRYINTSLVKNIIFTFYY